ncbi:MAG: MTH1187 family thiamine-binding protein [Terracidiphilus sp.]|nr:MTH1187 family thiamine-binding protein [Terracidiphilus sp.]
MVAGFTVVPMTAGESVSELVAESLKIVDASGLDYQLGPMQTVLEGDEAAVMETIMKCHHRMMELAPRVLTTISIDDRKGATGRLRGKVADVEKRVGKTLSRVAGE